MVCVTSLTDLALAASHDPVFKLDPTLCITHHLTAELFISLIYNTSDPSMSCPSVCKSLCECLSLAQTLNTHRVIPESSYGILIACASNCVNTPQRLNPFGSHNESNIHLYKKKQWLFFSPAKNISSSSSSYWKWTCCAHISLIPVLGKGFSWVTVLLLRPGSIWTYTALLKTGITHVHTHI